MEIHWIKDPSTGCSCMPPEAPNNPWNPTCYVHLLGFGSGYGLDCDNIIGGDKVSPACETQVSDASVAV